jgi:hypothetical protein
LSLSDSCFRTVRGSADDTVSFQFGDLVVIKPDFGQQLVIVLT